MYIPCIKEKGENKGKLDFKEIQRIGRTKNPNFTIHEHEKSDLDKINIDFLSNYKCNPTFEQCAFNKSVVVGDVIPKITKLLNGVNYKIEEPRFTKTELDAIAKSFQSPKF